MDWRLGSKMVYSIDHLWLYVLSNLLSVSLFYVLPLCIILTYCLYIYDYILQLSLSLSQSVLILSLFVFLSFNLPPYFILMFKYSWSHIILLIYVIKVTKVILLMIGIWCEKYNKILQIYSNFTYSLKVYFKLLLIRYDLWFHYKY